MTGKEDELELELLEMGEEAEEGEEGEDEGPGISGYIEAKAARYLSSGPNQYRADDALGQPPRGTPKPMLVKLEAGCRQLLAGRGGSADRPLEGLEVDGFYALLTLFHFELEQQRASFSEDGSVLDRMEMVHAIDPGLRVTLYNRVMPRKSRRR